MSISSIEITEVTGDDKGKKYEFLYKGSRPRSMDNGVRLDQLFTPEV